MVLKKITLLFSLCLSIILSTTAQELPNRPEPVRFVNDFAGILGENAGALEAKLRAYNDSTSTQLAVITVTSLNGYDINDFGQRIGEQWGIGQKGKNNGLLILVAPKEHKMTIQTGYGMEAFVPDAKAKWIIDNLMKPAFKSNDYAGGIDAAVNEIMNKASGAYKRDGSETDKKTGSKKSNWIVWLVILGFILFSFFRNRSNGGYSRYSSGGALLGGGLLGGFGGGFGGGSSGGGGSFGGGSFGGGGASGDW